MEERRIGSINELIIHVGEIKQLSQSVDSTVRELKEKVTIQNGRVGKLERWQAFIQGGLAILTILVLPVFFMVASTWIKLHGGA